MRQRTMRRRLAGAVSVVLAAGTSVVVELATSDPDWVIGSGLGVAVLSWAAFEWWRAEPRGREGKSRKRLAVKMRVAETAGPLKGAEGNPNAEDVEITQKVRKVLPGGSVTGYTSGSER